MLLLVLRVLICWLYLLRYDQRQLLDGFCAYEFEEGPGLALMIGKSTQAISLRPPLTLRRTRAEQLHSPLTQPFPCSSN